MAIYRHKDSRRYAACGPIDAAASHRLTRGTKSFLNREDHAPRLRSESSFDTWRGSVNEPGKSARQKVKSCRFPRPAGGVIMTRHRFEPKGRTSSMDMPRKHLHKCIRKVASLYKVRVRPSGPNIASASWKNGRVSIAKGRTLQKSRL